MTSQSSAKSTELAVRLVSGLVLAVAALLSAWAGGFLLFGFWLVAAGGVLVEWWRMTGDAITWRLLGIVYAAIAIISPLVLRSDSHWGLAALLWLFAVVWISDVMAYVCGRLIGGPKLWPRVSPGKTWAGFVGGTFFAGLGGAGVAAWADAPSLGPVIVLSVVAAIVSQAGDLLESALKRSFGVKDAGSLIPGHGGFMDRLDGFIAAGLFALALGLMRGGWDAAGQGLLVW
ncbi:phosphatidate cytidylyltransferase [Terrihabitans sp. B22-R8]|uniref:phosphatidate cytidylyltransferase n=1 Tax=Terrihabitans sp. B22-R8 TaxID=3425128 RepID=UPI00403C0956